MTKTVQTITLLKGTIIQQWVGKTGSGNYFTPLENGDAKNLGLSDYDKRDLQSFILTYDAKALKSTAADLKGYKGGEIQYFRPEPKNNSKPIN